jgi:hypothetical protein
LVNLAIAVRQCGVWSLDRLEDDKGFAEQLDGARGLAEGR